MEIEVDGVEISLEEWSDDSWTPPQGFRAQAKRHQALKQQAQMNDAQVSKAPKTPPTPRPPPELKRHPLPRLPSHTYHIVGRPKTPIDLTRTSPGDLQRALLKAASLCDLDPAKRDQLRIHPRNNTFTVSVATTDRAIAYQRITSILLGEDRQIELHMYAPPPDDAIRGISFYAHTFPTDDETLKDLQDSNPDYQIVGGRRMGKTKNLLITLLGDHLPRWLLHRGGLIRVYPFHPKVDACFNCRKTGHRSDVCPQPRRRRCPRCGEDHEPPPQGTPPTCQARCIVCQGGHMTNSSRCEYRFAKKSEPLNAAQAGKTLQTESPATQQTSNDDSPPALDERNYPSFGTSQTPTKRDSRSKSRSRQGQAASHSRSKSRTRSSSRIPHADISKAPPSNPSVAWAPSAASPLPSSPPQPSKPCASTHDPLVKELTQTINALKSQMATQQAQIEVLLAQNRSLESKLAKASQSVHNSTQQPQPPAAAKRKATTSTETLQSEEDMTARIIEMVNASVAEALRTTVQTTVVNAVRAAVTEAFATVDSRLTNIETRSTNVNRNEASTLQTSTGQKNARTEALSKPPSHNEPQLDKAWSRVVIACAATFFSSAVHSTSGFFYVAFMRQYGINRQAASWPTSVFQAVDDVSGVFVAVLQNFFAVSTVSLLGSVLFWVGIFASVFVPDITWMTFTFGFVQGAGSGIVSVASTMIMLMYFDKYRGFATGIRYTGYSLSSLLYAPVLALLDETFSFRQMMLLFGAISLHLTPLVLSLKEPPWEQKSQQPKIPVARAKENSAGLNCHSVRPDQPKEKQSQGKTIRETFTVNRHKKNFKVNDSSDNMGESGSEAVHYQRRANDSIVPNCIMTTQTSKSCAHSMNAMDHLCGRERSKTALSGMNGGFRAARISIGDTEVDTALQQYRARFALALSRSSVCATDGNPAASSSESSAGRTASHLSLFLKPTFWALILGGVLADYTDCAFMATIVDSALDRGATRYQADLSIACSAPSQLLGRAVLPLIADIALTNRASLACVCYFLFGACVATLATTTSFVTYAPCMALASLFMGCLTTMKHVVAADFFGVDVVPVAWATTGVVLLPMLLGNPSILGFFRDKQGAYNNFYYVLGSFHLLTGSIFIILLYSTSKRQKKWTLKASKTEANGFGTIDHKP
ncbi:uncharacterized protein LOC119171194 [Rhipicephalus microplus]|uniref:uncharacterized protein LOC119171194 n=1 Tax=Rhipicephalus microplus TaxID=6941 RepID=UPI003F6D793B